VDDSRLRVLLVDDDPVITAVAAIALSGDAIAVIQATDLAGALASMAGLAPDIVVLDAATRELDGWEAAGLYRPDCIPRDARIMLLRPQLEGGGLPGRLIVVGYLNKPFDPCELIAAIRSVTRNLA
jgi:DNA-binding response OmpR family regulator